MKIKFCCRSLKTVLLVCFIVGNISTEARDLSEIFLSLDKQENYYDYQIDVFLQQEGYGDQSLNTKYPDLVKSSAESLKKFMQSLDDINHNEYPDLKKK